MREIGLALGVVESRVSQVHSSAVVHLRVALKDLAARGAFQRTPPRKPPAQVLLHVRNLKEVNA